MNKKGSILVVVFLILVMTMISGCINSNTTNKPVPTPDTSAIYLTGNGYEAYLKGNYETALDYYNKSIAANPSYARAWREKGNVLILLNRTSEAIAVYDSALALDNNFPEIWNNRGEALMTLGRYAEARDSFDKALQIAPDYAKAKENRNLTLSKLK
jgi:tetratricopeptide (TPR) repeat protein